MMAVGFHYGHSSMDVMLIYHSSSRCELEYEVGKLSTPFGFADPGTSIQLRSL